jgi:hypothetical protein
MSIHVQNKVWWIEPDALTTPQRFVLMALADSSDDEGHSFPHVKYLCGKTGLCDKSVRVHLDALEEGGWLTRCRRVRGVRRGGYDYAIVLHMLDEHRQEPTGYTGRNLPVIDRQKPTALDRQVSTAPYEPSIEPSTEEPSTTTSPPERTNKWEGTCLRCECIVEAGTGVLVGKKVRHADGKCASRRRNGEVGEHATNEEWA